MGTIFLVIVLGPDILVHNYICTYVGMSLTFDLLARAILCSNRSIIRMKCCCLSVDRVIKVTSSVLWYALASSSNGMLRVLYTQICISSNKVGEQWNKRVKSNCTTTIESDCTTRRLAMVCCL